MFASPYPAAYFSNFRLDISFDRRIDFENDHSQEDTSDEISSDISSPKDENSPYLCKIHLYVSL